MSAAVQSGFAAALRDPGLPPPVAAAAKRFAVYRNNVAVSLAAAVGSRFPAIARIVGEECFGGLARAYVDACPPRSPLMMTFGDDFPEFLSAAPHLSELPYLADVARLEAARTRAYHAADAEPLGLEAFAALDPDDLDQVAVELHPSVETVRSAHPVVTIWAMNAGDAEPRPIEDWRPEDALVCRPAMDVVVLALPAGGADFLDALSRGETLGEAAAQAATVAPDFDLTQNLIGLIETGLAVRIGRAEPNGAKP